MSHFPHMLAGLETFTGYCNLKVLQPLFHLTACAKNAKTSQVKPVPCPYLTLIAVDRNKSRFKRNNQKLQ